MGTSGFSPLTLLLFSPCFQWSYQTKGGISAPRLHEMRAVAETCQESHNTSEVANHGASEGKHQIHPATSMVTEGNTEEIDQK